MRKYSKAMVYWVCSLVFLLVGEYGHDSHSLVSVGCILAVMAGAEIVSA